MLFLSICVQTGCQHGLKKCPWSFYGEKVFVEDRQQLALSSFIPDFTD